MSDNQNISINANESILKPENSDDTNVWLRYGRVLFKSGVINLATITALVTTAGFFIVHVYLASVTNVTTHNISLSIYIASGIGMFITLTYKYMILPILLGVVIFLSISWILVLFKVSTWSEINKRVILYIQKILKNPIVTFLSGIHPIYLIIVIIPLSYSYGRMDYAATSQAIGGGQPVNVIILFKERQENLDGILPFNHTLPNRTDIVELIIELTDGYLIRNKTTGVTVIIKNDLIQAIVDPSKLPTSSPTPILSATPDPLVINASATPAATATP